MNINEITVEQLNAAEQAFGNETQITNTGKLHDLLGEKVAQSNFSAPLSIFGHRVPPQKWIALGIDIGLKLAVEELRRENEAIAA